MSGETSRRVFLQTTGAAVLGIGCGIPLVRALASEIEDEQGTGPRWAMVVDTRKCAETCGKIDGSPPCAAACHRIHNVPTKIEDPKEEVKWIWTEPYEHTFPGRDPKYLSDDLRGQDVLVLCNHCENPPCVRVCPTQATWKRDDGIVMMDMHRCIGCRYCIVGCPYGSRSFNWKDPRPHIEEVDDDFPTRSKGVVEKCNFCSEKARDSADGTWTPECVAVCPEKALIWGDISDPESELRKTLAERFTVLRKPELGTRPRVFYLV